MLKFSLFRSLCVKKGLTRRRDSMKNFHYRRIAFLLIKTSIPLELLKVLKNI